MPPRFTRHTILRLAVLAHVDPRTAQRWLEGTDGHPGPDEALSVAAKGLGIARDAAAPGPDVERRQAPPEHKPPLSAAQAKRTTKHTAKA